MTRDLVAAALLLVAAAPPALAQTSTTIDAEVTSDERRRGLSWSEGRVAPSAELRASSGAFDAGVRLVALRGSARAAGADGVADLDLAYTLPLGGGFDLVARGTAHLFAGARGVQDYVEGGGDLGYLLGPVQATGGVRYAPVQGAIGGDNLYLFARLDGGVPGTPFTLHGQIGRSSGRVDDPAAAARLRPDGSYVDWSLGAARVRGPWTVAVDYVGTDIDRRRVTTPLGDGAHAGDALVGRIGYRF